MNLNDNVCMNYKTASTIFNHYENKSGDRIRFPRLFILF